MTLRLQRERRFWPAPLPIRRMVAENVGFQILSLRHAVPRKSDFAVPE